MKIDDYQKQQQDLLYGDGTHRSHDMFLDLSEMEMYCLQCNEARGYRTNPKLVAPCQGKINGS